jgi:hypothetical protein
MQSRANGAPCPIEVCACCDAPAGCSGWRFVRFLYPSKERWMRPGLEKKWLLLWWRSAARCWTSPCRWSRPAAGWRGAGTTPPASGGRGCAWGELPCLGTAAGGGGALGRVPGGGRIVARPRKDSRQGRPAAARRQLRRHLRRRRGGSTPRSRPRCWARRRDHGAWTDGRLANGRCLPRAHRGASSRGPLARGDRAALPSPLLQGEIDFLKIQHLSQEEVVSGTHDLYERWDDLSQEDRRGVARPS